MIIREKETNMIGEEKPYKAVIISVYAHARVKSKRVTYEYGHKFK